MSDLPTVLDLTVRDSLDIKIARSKQVIREAAKRSGDIPLIINFSGGKDSMCVLELTREITNNFVCFYMVSGIEFPEAVEFVKSVCEKLGVKLLISRPEDYLGGFFERLARLRSFPTIRSQWCSRDLKVRAQTRVIQRTFGKNKSTYKLVAIRCYESARRAKIYRKNIFVKRDQDCKPSFMVFPILLWTDGDVKEFLKRKRMILPKNPLYEKYGVSGCYWCPFYQPAIYKRILRIHPDIYDQFIEWEERLMQPSVNGHVWLRDLKKEVLAETDTNLAKYLHPMEIEVEVICPGCGKTFKEMVDVDFEPQHNEGRD